MKTTRTNELKLGNVAVNKKPDSKLNTKCKGMHKYRKAFFKKYGKYVRTKNGNISYAINGVSSPILNIPLTWHVWKKQVGAVC